MAKVFGVEVSSDKMAGIAKKLLWAHCCVVFMTVLGGILSIVGNVTMTAAIDDLEADTNSEADASEFNGAGSYTVDILGRLIIPVCLFFLVRFAIQGNNQGLMRCVCFTDACGICLEFCGGIVSVIMIVAMIVLKEWAEDEECIDYGYWNDDPNWTHEDCMKAREDAMSVFDTALIIYIVVAILACLSMLVCCWATKEANDAQNALTAGEVFVGAPVQAVQGEVVVGKADQQ
mmetsp:Transcript_93400/g.194855  ORF Transcript_93400/g.194855 Transcript_93400/m.194855 type:complete len:232 (-) Transcript_93400:139-834(-)